MYTSYEKHVSESLTVNAKILRLTTMRAAALSWARGPPGFRPTRKETQ